MKQGDSLKYMKDILGVFGHIVKGYYKCSWNKVWSPTLSVDGSNKGGWVNTIDDDLTHIYECYNNKTGEKEKKTISDADYHIKQNTERYVFLKYTNVLGISCRKFLGVYKVLSQYKYNEEKHAVVWSLISTTANIH